MRLVQIDMLRAKIQELDTECIKKGTARQITIYGYQFLTSPNLAFQLCIKVNGPYKFLLR